MAVMVMLYTTVLSTKMRNADGRSGHGGGEAEGQWITFSDGKTVFVGFLGAKPCKII